MEVGGQTSQGVGPDKHCSVFATPRLWMRLMKSLLDHLDYGVVVLDGRFRAHFINRSFREIWRLPRQQADNQPSFSDLILHGRDTKAYAVPDSQLDGYVSQRVRAMHLGNVRSQDLSLSDGRVIRLQCGQMPEGGRLLSYIDVTDLAAKAESLAKKLAVVIDSGPVPNGEAQLHTGGPWQVLRAEAYMEANWDQQIDADDIAGAIGTSQRSLFRAFQQSRGYSPMEFVRRSRLRHAQRMLKLPDAATTVSSVALACGFTDLGQFSKTYRNAFGEAPSQVLHRAKRDVV